MEFTVCLAEKNIAVSSLYDEVYDAIYGSAYQYLTDHADEIKQGLREAIPQLYPAPKIGRRDDNQRQVIQKPFRRDHRSAETVFFAQIIVSDPEKENQRHRNMQNGSHGFHDAGSRRKLIRQAAEDHIGNDPQDRKSGLIFLIKFRHFCPILSLILRRS